jgi:sortase A
MKKNKTLARIIAAVCGISGIGVLSYVFFPIFLYELNTASKDYLSPIPLDQTYSVEAAIDFTKPSNWFVGNVQPEFADSNVRFYTLSIPKLKIKQATVAIGGEDLSKSLIQYAGTAVPGNPGNAVIFGHSILPQFYDPKDYMAIFSTVPTLQKGDEIFVDYDGVSYTYRVEDKFEVAPTDVQILQQNTSDSFLQLVTCTPPGDPRRPKRMIVRARVVPPATASLY